MNDVESSMAQLMAAGDIAPEPRTNPVAVMVSEMMIRYVQKFGNARLQILRLGSCSSDDLRRYLNTLRITLIRKNVQFNYLWQYDPSQSSYILFLCHYDAHSEPILQTAYRLWHGSCPIQTLNSIHVDQSNLSDTAAWLSQSFSDLASTPMMTPFYQHSFGYSRSL